MGRRVEDGLQYVQQYTRHITVRTVHPYILIFLVAGKVNIFDPVYRGQGRVDGRERRKGVWASRDGGGVCLGEFLLR